jgi:hypothetical protein
VDDTIAVKGEVERTTDFAKGMPNAYGQVDGHYQKDHILDDDSDLKGFTKENGPVSQRPEHSDLKNT